MYIIFLTYTFLVIYDNMYYFLEHVILDFFHLENVGHVKHSEFVYTRE